MAINLKITDDTLEVEAYGVVHSIDLKKPITIAPIIDNSNFTIKANTVTNLEIGKKLKIVPINFPQLFKLHHFIYQGDAYIVKINFIIDNEITFYNSINGCDMSINLNEILMLSVVKEQIESSNALLNQKVHTA